MTMNWIHGASTCVVREALKPGGRMKKAGLTRQMKTSADFAFTAVRNFKKVYFTYNSEINLEVFYKSLKNYLQILKSLNIHVWKQRPLKIKANNDYLLVQLTYISFHIFGRRYYWKKKQRMIICKYPPSVCIGVL